MALRLFCILFLCCVLQNCKHESNEIHENITINPSNPTATLNDSIHLLIKGATTPYTWEIMPNIGYITSDNWYIAPSSIYQNNTLISINLKIESKTVAATQLIIVRSNIQDSIISFSQIIRPLFIANCNFSGCHGNGSHAAKVELSNYTNTIKHIVAFQPNKSLLYLSLLKPDPLRIMPPAGPLQAAKIAFIKKWIEQGALNN